MLLNKKKIIVFLISLIVFLNAFGLDRNFLLISGINLYFIFYILLLFILLQDLKKINLFFKSCRKCKIFILLISILIVFVSFASLSSLYYLDATSYSVVFSIIRFIIYISFFIIFPYLFIQYNINIKQILLVWLVGIIFDSLLWYITSPHVGKLIYLGGQNILGFYIAFSVFFSFYFLHFNINKKNYKKIIFYLFITLFLLASSLFTWSKGSWLSIIFSFIIVFMINLFKRKDFKFSFIILFVLIIIATLSYEIILALVTNEWSASSGSHSNDERLLSIIAGLKELLYSYFVGVGHKNYPVAIEYFQIKDVLWIQPDPHNTYIQLLSEYGLLSFFAFLLFIYNIYRLLNIKKLLDLYLFGSLLAMSIYGNFTGQLVSQQFIYLFGSIILGYYLQNKKYFYAKNNISY